MKRKRSVTVFVVLLCTSLSLHATESNEAIQKKVKEVYPSLTTGVLAFAELEELPADTLLRADSVVIKAESINKIIESQPEAGKEEFKKNAFFLLEQEAANQILINIAKKALDKSEIEVPIEDNIIVQQYFERDVFKNLSTTDEEVREFYENNKDMCGGASLDQVKSALKDYVLGQKKQEIAAEYIRTLGKQVRIQVSDGWVKKQAVLAFDNAVDKARQSGKPSFVDFGASGCRPCDMMTPILDTLKSKYKNKLNVVFIHVREKPILASRYGIQSIPVQVFFNKNGEEVFRHAGFFPQKEIEMKLAEMEVK